MMTVEWLLVGLFLVHFVAFVVLGVRRRTWRYLPATVTFALLVTLHLSSALDVGSDGLRDGLRLCAYVGLGVSLVSWAWRRFRRAPAG